MKIYNLKDKLEYLDEVARLEYEEWADNKEENKEERKLNVARRNIKSARRHFFRWRLHAW